MEAVTLDKNSVRTANATVACLAGGPFWSMEAIFSRVPGVISVLSGFSGGNRENPSYLEVCGGKTGHCEAIRVEFDPVKISYEKLLEIFWESHDPTQFNSTFNLGPQYRSVIFYHDDQQKSMAELSRKKTQSDLAFPILTQIKPFKNFYRANDRHQGYYEKNVKAPYC